jgi:hypothetical protein
VTPLRLRSGAHLGRELALVAGVVVLLGAVAITAGMARPAAGSSQPPAIPLRVLLAWGAVAAVVGGALLAVTMPLWSRREKWVAVAVFAVLLLGFAVLAERSHPPAETAVQQQESASPLPEQVRPKPTTAQQVPPAAAQHPSAGRAAGTVAPWVIALASGAALLLAALALLPRGGRAARSRPDAAAAALGAALDSSMAQVEREADPRRAVVAAWIAMGDALARHGLGRDPAEAPLEYMHRALRAVRVSSVSVQRLTALFQRARYSDHPATPAMRAEALTALQHVRDDLDVESPR